MSKTRVRFILGRSGSGKTRYCLQSIGEQLKHDALGSSLVLLVPEQATFQMEQALLDQSGLPGFHRAHVLSFNRLAQQVFLQTTFPPRPALSEMARQMILRHLLQNHRDQLAIFGESAEHPGFVTHLSAMIGEFYLYRHTPDQLRSQATQFNQEGYPDQAALGAKLSDMATILQAYRDYISDRFIDPEDLLSHLAEQCSAAPLLENATIWVDGFAGFTPQQYQVLQAFCHRADRVELSLCLDPQSSLAKQLRNPVDERPVIDSMDMFGPTLETYQRLGRLFAQSECVTGPPLELPERSFDSSGMPRFRKSPTLAKLEQNFVLSTSGLNPPGATDSSESRAIPTADAVIVMAPNRRSEVEAVARHIQTLCRDHHYRYRDIAVILRDFSDYQVHIETLFAEYDIPFFLDQRRSLRHHPLIECIRSALNCLSSGFDNDIVFDYLKTQLTPLSPEQVDELENFTLAHGIHSSHWSDSRSWETITGIVPAAEPGDLNINTIRHEGLAALLQFNDSFKAGRPDHKSKYAIEEICPNVYALIEELRVGDTLARWTKQAETDGDPHQVLTHQQVYADLIELLDEMVETLGDFHVDLEQFGEIFQTALSQMSLALVPPSLDQVLIGSIERSRHPQIRAAFVLGLNEGRFPRHGPPDSFFTDRQRQHLIEQGFELTAARQQLLLEERYLGYIAFTRPQEFLWVSFTLADASGNRLNPSAFIDHIRSSLPGIPEITVDPLASVHPEQIVHPQQLGRDLAAALSPHNSEVATQAPWRELGAALTRRKEWSGLLKACQQGWLYHNVAFLDPAVAGQLYGSNLTTSVSRLESFARCPFQHFSQYALDIRDRDKLKLQQMNLGDFYHQGICEIFRQLKKQETNWREASIETLDELVESVSASLINEHPEFKKLYQQSWRNRHRLDRCSHHLKRLCRNIQRAARASDFTQQEAEMEFGPGKPLPGLELHPIENTTVALQGKIDRVDLCRLPDGDAALTLVDYKTSGKSFSFDQFYYGLSLQLMSYLQALMRIYGPTLEANPAPAAAVFLALTQTGDSQEGPPPDAVWEERQETPEATLQATGLINQRWCQHLDNTAEPKTSSKFYNFRVKKEGEPYGVSVLEPDKLHRLLDFNILQLTEMTQRLIAGDIAITPYQYKKQTGCDFCVFKPVCRFDKRHDRFDSLPTLKRDAVMDKIQKQLERKESCD